MAIHPTAVIDKRAEIGENNEIGPHVVIEGPVKLGADNKIGPGAVITGITEIGRGNQIHGHAYIGNIPQDLSFKDAGSRVMIGDNNTIREFATIHRGTKEGSATVIGNNNYLMVSCHIAHNCTLGDHITMVNNASIAGYCEIHDHAFVSGFVVAHQFTRFGSYSITGLSTKVTKDIPPFVMVDGNPARVRGLNLVGLKRHGFSAERRNLLKKAHDQIFRSGSSIPNSLAELEKIMKQADDPMQADDLKKLVDFIRNSKRGILLKGSGADRSEAEE